MPVVRTALPATIASGTSLSDAVDLLGYDLIGIEFPDDWTTAGVTLQTSSDGKTFRDVYTANGTEVSLSGAGADKYVTLESTLAGLISRFVKVRSGTAGSPVNQAADRTIYLVGRAEV